MKFEYQPLDEPTHEIRLLTFCKDLHGNNGRLRCTLEHVPLTQDSIEASAPERRQLWRNTLPLVPSHWGLFDAVSYPWGDGAPTSTIELNGHDYELPQNAFEALIAVRQRMIRTPKRCSRVWIDVICIDQTNMRERNLQVSRMRYIYSSARVVYCFLPGWASMIATSQKDDNEGDCRLVLEMLVDISKHAERKAEFIQRLRIKPHQYSLVGWRLLLSFFNNPFWSRLWIVQEIALAGGMVDVLFGSCSINFDQVSRAINVIDSGFHITGAVMIGAMRSARMLSDDLILRRANGLRVIKRITEARVLYWRHREWLFQHPAETLLVVATHAMTKDPRDRVYGMLSLLHPRLAQVIQVDYEKPLRGLYIEFAKAVIECTGRLEILNLHISRWRLDTLPSWVPDLETPSPFSLLPAGSHVNIAPPGDPPRIDGLRLSASGVIVDCVDGLTSSYYMTHPHEDCPPEILYCQVLPSNPLPHDPFRNDRNRVARFFLDLCKYSAPGAERQIGLPCRGYLARRSDSYHPDYILTVLNSCEEFFQQTIEWSETPGIIPAHQGHDPIVFLDDNPAVESVYDLCGMLYGQRVAWTTSQRLVLVPELTRPGDLICALPRTVALTVLRAVGEDWALVGSCYAEGPSYECRKEDVREFRVI